MKIFEKIESLRSEKSAKEIETMLLDGKLGKIYPDGTGYVRIENILLSWLVVEVHKPGFVQCMWMHPYKYVVHHIDGDILNNICPNLKVMKWGTHTSMHINEYFTNPDNANAINARNKAISEAKIAYFTDPANAEDIKTQRKKSSEWFSDPTNAEAIKTQGRRHSEWYKDPTNVENIRAIGKAISKSLTAYFVNPDNAEAIKARIVAMSETKRKINNWVELTTFKKPFTVGDYAKVSGISVVAAWHRLAILAEERQIVCEKRLVNRKWCNVYSAVKEIRTI